MNTRLLVLILLNLLVVLLQFAQESTGQGTTEKVELFSYEKLRKYTSLASCFAKIHEKFAFCNKKAEEKGRAYLEGIDPNSEWAKRVKCCGTWRLRDCWVSAAKDKCDPMQTELVHNLPYTFMPKIEEMCAEYPPGSPKCSIPWLLIGLVLTAIVVLISIGVFCGVRFYRKKKRDQRIRRQQEIVETQKIKPVPV